MGASSVTTFNAIPMHILRLAHTMRKVITFSTSVWPLRLRTVAWVIIVVLQVYHPKMHVHRLRPVQWSLPTTLMHHDTPDASPMGWAESWCTS